MELTLRNTMTMTCRLITGIPSPTLLSLDGTRIRTARTNTTPSWNSRLLHPSPPLIRSTSSPLPEFLPTTTCPPSFRHPIDPNRPRRAPSAIQPSFTPLPAANSPLPPLSRIRLLIPPHPPTPLDSALSNTRSRTRRTRLKHRLPPSTRRRTSRPPPSCTPTPWAMSPLTMSVTVGVRSGREPKATARPASWRSLARRRR